jgi:hypothetical protein
MGTRMSGRLPSTWIFLALGNGSVVIPGRTEKAVGSIIDGLLGCLLKTAKPRSEARPREVGVSSLPYAGITQVR